MYFHVSYNANSMYYELSILKAMNISFLGVQEAFLYVINLGDWQKIEFVQFFLHHPLDDSTQCD